MSHLKVYGMAAAHMLLVDGREYFSSLCPDYNIPKVKIVRQLLYVELIKIPFDDCIQSRLLTGQK